MREKKRPNPVAFYSLITSLTKQIHTIPILIVTPILILIIMTMMMTRRRRKGKRYK